MIDSLSHTCLSELRLRNVLHLSEELAGQDLEHLQTCRECQRILDQLTESEFLASYRNARASGAQELSFLAAPSVSGDLGSIDQYAIEAILESGGMGVVLRGRDDQLGRFVAIKVLLNQYSSDSYARFEAESRAVARLVHQHIVPVYSVGRTVDNRPYMVMPLIDGCELSKLIWNGPLEPKLAAEYVRQVASGLAVAHNAGLIHRDIKPSNILIDRTDELAKIIDFGLVRDQSGQGLTQANVLCGTPAYMSVEQSGQSEAIDARSDVYSLGVTLYECLTGTTPFRGLPLEILEQHRRSEAVPPSNLNRAIPKDLETICLKAMAKERDRRYQSARDLEEDVHRFLTGRPILARPVSAIEKLGSWCNRNRPLSGTIGMLFFSLLAGTIGSTTMWLRSQQNADSARKFASDLQLSRDRMRDSVQKFQSRVFSDESLHWQMSSEFRSEMFRDVIRYLDEFSVFSSPSQATDKIGVEDPIVQSYLELANAALNVGQYEEAAMAARSAIVRLKSNPHVESSAALLLQRSSADKTMFLALRQDRATSDVQLESYASECLRSLEAARRLNPEELSLEVFQLSTLVEFMEAGSRQHAPSSRQSRIEEVRDRIENLVKQPISKEVKIRLRRSLAHAYWILIESLEEPGAIALFQASEENIRIIRDLLRQINKPLLESDRLNGKNKFLLGACHKKNNDIPEAIVATKASIANYMKAVQLHPQNRIWRLELADVQSKLAEYHSERKEWQASRDAINAAIVNCVQSLETDPKDLSLRVTIIQSLIQFGELSTILQDYKGAYRGFATAAQDCLILMKDTDLQAWAFNTRVWALVHSYNALEHFESSTEKTSMVGQVQGWFKSIGREEGGLDVDWAMNCIEQRILPERIETPAQFTRFRNWTK